MKGSHLQITPQYHLKSLILYAFSISSICLPMEVKDYPDTIYIITVLGLNGLGFAIVVICYVQIYLNLGNQDFTKPHALNRDMVVAKKMALLVSLCKVCANV